MGIAIQLVIFVNASLSCKTERRVIKIFFTIKVDTGTSTAKISKKTSSASRRFMSKFDMMILLDERCREAEERQV
jgi:hypothetical protein